MLITTDDIRKHRPVADNIDEKRRMDIYIKEAENLYIVPNIGAELYKKLNDNPTTHTLLLDGGYYNDDKNYFQGLKAALSLLAYSRFIRNNELNTTPFGVKFKIAMDSGQVDEKSIVRHANEAEKTGLSYLQSCIDYIKFNSVDCYNNNKLKMVRKYKVIGK